MTRIDQTVWLEALRHPPAKALAKIRENAERVDNSERIRGMVLVGRMLAEEKPVAQFVISELRKGDFAERFMALNSCHGSRDGDHLVLAATDRSETIRAVARRMLCLYGSDDQVAEAFKHSPRSTRKGFLRQLTKKGRFAAVDRIVSSLDDADPQDFAALLPFASPELVSTHWPRIEADSSITEWARLTRGKSSYAKERILGLLEQTPDFEPRIVWIANKVLSILAKRGTAGSVSVVLALLRTCPLSQIDLVNVLEAFPREVAWICAEQEDLTRVNLHYAYSKLDDDELLLKLMRKYPTPYGIVRVLKKLPTSSRRLLYDNLNPAWRAENDGLLDDGILEVMPSDIREREARLHLSMASLQSNPQLRLIYASFLPFIELQQVLAAPLTDPDAELRGVAWTSLVASLRYHRKELGYVLNEVKKRKKEQDPVRNRIMTALFNLPPILWKPEHLPDLQRIIEDALEARDLSGDTVSYIERLLIKIAPFHIKWTAQTLAYVWRERGQSGLQSTFAFDLNDEQARQVEAEIVPVLKQWNKKQYEYAVIRVAGLFGNRLKICKDIVALLSEIVLNAAHAGVSENALSWISRLSFNSLAELIPQMLKKDASWGTVSQVVQYLYRYRQDLLTPYLGQVRHRGRFNNGRVAIVPDLGKGMSRLSSQQHLLYGKVLASMASVDENRRFENFFVIKKLSLIPSCPISYFTRMASASNERIYERDLAIMALANLDEGQGVPLLVEAVEDPARAYVAIYALRKCLLKMPAEAAYTILKKASRKQITVFKEIVRLLGDIRHEDALQELYSLIHGELHRDVRVAAICALWSNLDREESWTVLNEAVDHEDDAIAFTVIRTPGERLTKDGEKQLLTLMLRGVQHNSPRVRMKTLERLSQIPVSDPDAILLDAIIESLKSDADDECDAAASALVRLYGHKALNAFPQAATAIISKRRNLVCLIDCLEDALAVWRSKLMPATYATIAALEKDPLTLTLRVRLAVASMPWAELGQWFKELDDKCLFHPDVLTDLGDCMMGTNRKDLDDMQLLEESLTLSDSVILRRIGLYALSVQAKLFGWDGAKLERLEAFRNDRSPYIAEVAQFTLPHEEEALKAVAESADTAD